MAPSILSRMLACDRIDWMALCIVVCFVGVLLLPSQSAASYPTYLLALLMLATAARWKDALQLPLVWLIGSLLIWLSSSTLWSDPLIYVMRYQSGSAVC